MVKLAQCGVFSEEVLAEAEVPWSGSGGGGGEERETVPNATLTPPERFLH